jgi:hypothetical protein
MRTINLLFLTFWVVGCAWNPISTTKVYLTLGEGRTLTTLSALPFGIGDKLVLRVASTDGLTVYKEKVYTAPSSNYSLEADNLTEGLAYRALVFYEDGYNQVISMDSRQFFLLGDTQTLTLKLGHAAKIILNTPQYTLFLNSLNPTQFKTSGNAIQLDPGAKIQLNIPSQHASTLTSFEYRVNGGPWTSVNASAQPIITFPTLGIYTIQVRYRQESNGEWLVYTFVISHLV